MDRHQSIANLGNESRIKEFSCMLLPISSERDPKNAMIRRYAIVCVYTDNREVWLLDG